MSAAPDFEHSASDLLAYEPFIRSIARRLIADENRVGDVVQDTWLRALTKAPRETGSLRSWLASVARNLALDEHRREGNRRERERNAAREEGVFEGERNLELHAKLVEAVLALEEPYKSVVILRYYSDRSPAEIARDLDRNAATVRSQLHRAHELLKEKLDRKFDGDRAAWVALCIPFAGSAVRTGGLVLALQAGTALLLIGGAAAAWHWMPHGQATQVRDVQARTALAHDEAFASTAPETSQELAATSQPPRTSASSDKSVLVTLDDLPVHNADVWCLFVSDIDPEVIERDPLLSSDPERLFPMFGTHSLTNEAGRAVLRTARGEFAVYVTHGTHSKILTLQETESPELEARLERSGLVAVRVVDMLGNPVSGVPVVLRATRRAEDDGISLSSRDCFTYATNKDEGLVRFRLHPWTERSAEPPLWTVRLGVPGTGAQQTRVEPDHKGDLPLTLRLGSTGSLTVRTVDADGEVLALEGKVQLRKPGLDQATLDLPLVAGVAHYPLVGTNTELEARVTIPALGASWSVRGPGPGFAGAEATLDIVRPQSPQLQGRVLDLDGQPLAKTELTLFLLSEAHELRHVAVVATDAAGIFRHESQLLVPGERAHLLLTRHARRGIDARAETTESFVFDEPTDVGDLALFAAPGWIEGHCVDEQGTPLEGIRLSTEQDHVGPPSRAISGPGGHFGLGGVFPESSVITVDGGSRWVLDEPVSAQRGQSDLELVLVPGGWITGSVVVDDGLDVSRIEVRAFEESNPVAIPESSTRCNLTASFLLQGLRTASYRLEFTLDGVPLAELRDVAVTASKQGYDPRVSPVDLRAGVNLLCVRVVDTLGKPIQGARVQLLAGGLSVADDKSKEDGVVCLLRPEASAMLLHVGAPGMRGVLLEATRNSHEVALEPGIAVELSSLTQLDLRSRGAMHQLSLRRIEEDPELAGLERTVRLPLALARGEGALVRFPAPGRYRLQVSSHYPIHGEPRGSTNAAPQLDRDYILEVHDGSEVVAATLELPNRLAD